MTLQRHFCIAECSISNPGRKSCIEGIIQHIRAMPFGIICFNEAGVRLYHDLAKQKPVFCDATGTVVSLPKDSCNKKPTLYYYALVVKHPILHKPPIAVAELITAYHTVLSISFFLQQFCRAESLLFSSVLLLSFLQVYNMETLPDNWTFRVATGAGPAKDALKVHHMLAKAT